MERREKEQRFTLGECSYQMVTANGSPALENALAFGAALEGLTIPQDKDGHVTEFPIGQILRAVASPEFADIRRFLLKHVTVIPADGSAYRLDEVANIDRHLNEYPENYVPLIGRAIKFQFGRFFPAGGVAKLMAAIPANIRASLAGTSTGSSTSQ